MSPSRRDSTPGYLIAGAWLLIGGGAACGRYGYDALDGELPGDGGGPAAGCELAESFDDYATTTVPEFTARWQVGALDPGASVQLEAGQLWLDDINVEGSAGHVTVTSSAVFGGDCSVRVRVRGETQCPGPNGRGYAVVRFLLRDADDPERFMGWEMPWDCNISGNPPQRIFSQLGDHWTDPNRDQDFHLVELRRSAGLVTALVDDVERFSGEAPYGDFRIELGGYSAATFGSPAGMFYDEVSAQAP